MFTRPQVRWNLLTYFQQCSLAYHQHKQYNQPFNVTTFAQAKLSYLYIINYTHYLVIKI